MKSVKGKQRKRLRPVLPCTRQPLKRLLPALLAVMVLGGCQSVGQISIDYLQPADISFPETLRRVAVVDNVPAVEEPVGVRFSHEGPLNYFHGDAAIATESLAQAIADQNYFDEVVVCDSALRAGEGYVEPRMLDEQEVERLTQELDVDFLIALEGVQISAVRRLMELPQWGDAYYGSVDATVLPTVRIYLPGRKTPMLTVNRADSIFWEETGSQDYVEAFLVSDRRMVLEASEFAGTVPVKKLLPMWKTTQRYLYAGGSVNMRDAALFARQDEWDKAIELWQESYQSGKKPKQRMQAAFNLALGYEMQDSIDTALSWIAKAKEEAMTVDKVTQSDAGKIEALQSDATRTVMSQYYAGKWPDYIRALYYTRELEERNEQMVHLRTQMRRFDDEQ